MTVCHNQPGTAADGSASPAHGPADVIEENEKGLRDKPASLGRYEESSRLPPAVTGVRPVSAVAVVPAVTIPAVVPAVVIAVGAIGFVILRRAGAIVIIVPAAPILRAGLGLHRVAVAQVAVIASRAAMPLATDARGAASKSASPANRFAVVEIILPGNAAAAQENLRVATAWNRRAPFPILKARGGSGALLAEVDIAIRHTVSVGMAAAAIEGDAGIVATDGARFARIATNLAIAPNVTTPPPAAFNDGQLHASTRGAGNGQNDGDLVARPRLISRIFCRRSEHVIISGLVGGAKRRPASRQRFANNIPNRVLDS